MLERARSQQDKYGMMMKSNDAPVLQDTK